ncbi:LacI family transcriptional regulator [Paenibacillus sp. 1011MAR3C5]|uniref:LacI family DNA-binding transcriptional regulator n=1 Tax=Paenibacillus sp. 1011MAR3C5 TaxID=1675787 RepID=UPI000E6BBC20|nr:LacI family DNA-binding transcriptional regulator [Paenibacillus sp. 1011MAR3C5]RJE87547.1 LacI family transcriptional regulator [Paenibacillus sp. 1011MAR3C5]
MVKLKDIADQVGVSVSTVSRVINHDVSRSVNEDTRNRILEAAHTLGYKTNKLGKTAKGKRDAAMPGFHVGCVVAVPQNKYNHPYFSIILEGVERGLSSQGYRLEFIHSMATGDDLSDLQRLVKDHGVDGMIVVEGIQPEAYHWIKKNVRAVVGIDISDHEVPVIAYDRVAAAKAAVAHLIAKGHREIGFVGGPGRYGDIQREKRFRGFQHAMVEAGLAIDPDWIINVNWDVSQSYERMKEAFSSQGKRPTAFFCASDMMAIPAMRAATEQRLRIPEDVAFFSVDNIELSQFTSPPLTTIHVPKMEMGMIAAGTLLDYLNRRYTIPVKIWVPHELKLRHSTGDHS